MQSSPFDTPGAALREPTEVRRRSYLKGTQPLWKAFWLFFFLGTLGLYAVLWVGLYACLSLMVVWRCSKEASSPAWRLLARFFVCIPVLILAVLGGYCLWVIA